MEVIYRDGRSAGPPFFWLATNRRFMVRPSARICLSLSGIIASDSIQLQRTSQEILVHKVMGVHLRIVGSPCSGTSPPPREGICHSEAAAEESPVPSAHPWQGRFFHVRVRMTFPPPPTICKCTRSRVPAAWVHRIALEGEAAARQSTPSLAPRRRGLPASCPGRLPPRFRYRRS